MVIIEIASRIIYKPYPPLRPPLIGDIGERGRDRKRFGLGLIVLENHAHGEILSLITFPLPVETPRRSSTMVRP